MNKAFRHFKRMRYANVVPLSGNAVDEIMIGDYSVNEGGCTGEFSISWIDLGSYVCPKIEMYDDSWLFLKEYKELFEKLTELDRTNTTPKDMCKLLISLGFSDLSDTKEI